MIDNLLLKLQTEVFCTDVNAMARIDVPSHDPQTVGKMVIEQLLSNIE